MAVAPAAARAALKAAIVMSSLIERKILEPGNGNLVKNLGLLGEGVFTPSPFF